MLVFITLVLVFDLRIAFWVTLGIPLSFVGSLLLFGTADLTLNIGTLFAFFLLIGIVVDDAVVVGESIAASARAEERARGRDLGREGVVGPITVGVATTVLAFLPLLYVTAGYYQIVNVFPWVALFASPGLARGSVLHPARPPFARAALERTAAQHGPGRGGGSGWTKCVTGSWWPAASWAVRHVWLTLVCAVAVVLVSLLLFRTEAVRVVVFDRDLNAPTKASSESSRRACHKASNAR